MSGYNDLFDESAKAFVKGLLDQHKVDEFAFQEFDEDDATEALSSRTSPATASDDVEDLEDANELEAMSRFIDDVYLANILYDALEDTPEEVPSDLADFMVNDESIHNAAALIEEVVAESQAESLPGHPAIRKQQNGYRIDVNVNGVRLTPKFDTIEQAALALIYAKLKGITGKSEAGNKISDTAREKALNSFVALFNYSEEYKNLYNNIEKNLQKHRDNGVDIINIVNDLLESKKPQNNPSKRHRFS